MRLFCFPYAGAGSLVFRTWPQALPPQVEVISLLYPGRESRLRVPPLTSLPALVSAIATEMQPWLDRPFALFGHSLGGLIAFELARELRRRQAPLPLHLFVSGRRAAHVPEALPPIAPLPDPAFIAAIQQRYNGIPKVILEDAELMELFLPVLRADFTLLETYAYQPEPAFHFPISAFVGAQDPLTRPAEAAAWQAHTHQPVALHTFPGDHFYIQPQRLPLLQSISQALAVSI